MKKIRSLLTVELIRPTVYRTVSKCAIMLTLVLLWDRYINNVELPVARDACFVAALVFFGLAWLAYLRLDGLKLPHLTEEQKKLREERKRRKRRPLTGDIVDYADEHIVPFDELSEEGQMACTLLSNLVSAVVFLIPCLISLIS